MPRKPRLYCSSEIYHVILRGNNKADLFLSDADRFFMLNKLKKYSLELNIDIYCYCLMSNHIHLLIGKANKYLSNFIQKLATSYACYFNRKYEHSGHVFQGRFKSEPVNDEIYFKTVLRYILKNPDNAKIGKFNKYKWNSFSNFLKRSKNNIIKTSFVISIFNSYKELLSFLYETSDVKCMEYENKEFLNNNFAEQFIRKIFTINELKNIKKTDKEILMHKFQILKKSGISKNQVARYTNLSKSIISIYYNLLN